MYLLIDSISNSIQDLDEKFNLRDSYKINSIHKLIL